MFILSLLFACDQDPSTEPEPQECVDIERSLIEEDTVAATVESNLDFAFSIYNQRTGEQDNLFMSPYSISTALGMLQLGARNDTEFEMIDMLGVSDPSEDWHSAQGLLNTELQLQDNCDYQLSTANRAYIQSDYNVEEAYTEGLNSFYNSPAESMDFASDPDGARQQINEWVAAQTNDKIPDLFPANSILSNTKLVLTNAIYLNAPWKTAFDPSRTYESEFIRADGSTTPVELMTQEEMELSVSEQEGFLLAEIPYKGDELVLTVLLPQDPAGLDAIIEGLDAQQWKSWKAQAYQTEGYVAIPKLELRDKKILNETLIDMGMESAFFPDSADFSGISTASDLHVSLVIHEAWLKFSEEGTEAAAATGVAVTDTAAMGPYIYLNQPFFFAIEDKLSGSMLFMGKITDPSQL